MGRYDDIENYEGTEQDASISRKRQRQRVRQFQGDVTEEMMDELEYEDDAEFESFEPIPRRPRRYR